MRFLKNKQEPLLKSRGFRTGKRKCLSSLSVAALLVAWLLGLSSSLHARVFYVHPEGFGDGSSWQDAAYDLAEILLEAEAGDEVWVAEGVYYPTEFEDRHASFVIKEGVKVYGGFVGTEQSLEERSWQYHHTVLSGAIGSDDLVDNSYTVVYLNGYSSQTVLDGFIIYGAAANGNEQSTDREKYGGGLFIEAIPGREVRPLIINCSFISNKGRKGAAVYAASSGSRVAPSFINCVFKQNSADLDGGALYFEGDKGEVMPLFESCVFENNEADYGGAICAAVGHGKCVVELRSCSFLENTAFLWGGGIYTPTLASGEGNMAEMKLKQCTFSDNYPTDINRSSASVAGSSAVEFTSGMNKK